MRAVALAGCSQIEHGVFATAEVLKLLAERGTYYDPQCSLVFRNYLYDNRPRFEGIGNYNAEGFAAMERAIPLALRVRWRWHPGPRWCSGRMRLRALMAQRGRSGLPGEGGWSTAHRCDRLRVAQCTRARLGDRLGSIAPGWQRT
jgi:hypothetical protein